MAWWTDVVRELKMRNMSVIQIAVFNHAAVPGVDKLETNLDYIQNMLKHVDVWIS